MAMLPALALPSCSRRGGDPGAGPPSTTAPATAERRVAAQEDGHDDAAKQATDEDAAAFDALGEPGEWVGLCDPESAAFAEATRMYEALERTVEAIDPTADAADFNHEANVLLDHECLALAIEDDGVIGFDMKFGVEAEAFWDAGGDVWFHQYLALANDEGSDIWLRPTPRDALTRETHPDHPLARFLCSAQLEDDPCAAAVGGWRSRANRYFELWSTSPRAEERSCLEEAEAALGREGYATWRDCENDEVLTHAALPLGGLGRVDEGWLVVRGRRGHYSFCDGIVAFDLATGATYRVESCSGLALRDDGSVDHRETDAKRRPQVQIGTIPVELLREAAWATFTADFVQSNAVQAFALGRPVPEGMEVGRHARTTWSGGGGFSWSSGHTRLDWHWSDGVDTAVLRGDLSWPDDLNEPGKDHAVRLLQIAEDAMEPGCAPVRLPGWIADGLELSGVSGLDTDAESLGKTSEALRDAIADAASRGRCPTKR